MKKIYLSPDYVTDEPAKLIIRYFDNKLDDEEGYIYYGFPTIKEIDSEAISPNLLIVLKKYGIYAIICDNTNNNREDLMNEIMFRGDTIDRGIYSKLLKNKDLCKDSRTLKFNFEVLYYLPNTNNNAENNNIFTFPNKIYDYIINKKAENNLDTKLIFSELEASSAIIKSNTRNIIETNKYTKAKALRQIETEIATFDEYQRIAGLSIINGPQRIRGLAGSGKTIILCLKAAYLHFKNPNIKILYTFYTKSLYDYIKLLITRFYLKLSEGGTPDFEKSIIIQHSWGGKNLNGVYYDTCLTNDIKPIPFSIAKYNSDEQFNYVCKTLLEETNGKLIKKYDFVLIDEAQDFEPSFYQLCRSIVKNDCIVWCYDELQNIFNVKLQNSLITFRNADIEMKGINLKTLSKKLPEISNDIVLPKSYRNLKEILVTAHAIGFGIYNDKLIQSLENNEHWMDLGYRVIEGDCNKKDKVVIERVEENSPLKMPKEYVDDDIITCYSAKNLVDECKWVSNEITKAIKEEGLNPEDIIVITFDDMSSHRYAEYIELELSKNDIKLNSVIDKSYLKGFIIDDSVTLSSVYKAKGNEAAMVFVIGCDSFDENKDSRQTRNKAFTAFTRAKVWLRISGVNIENSCLLNEIKMIKEKNYKMEFINKPNVVLERDWNEFEKKKEITEDFAMSIIKQAQKSDLDISKIIDLLSENGIKKEVKENEENK